MSIGDLITVTRGDKKVNFPKQQIISSNKIGSIRKVNSPACSPHRPVLPDAGFKKFVPKKFQKSPNLVTLASASIVIYTYEAFIESTTS